MTVPFSRRLWLALPVLLAVAGCTSVSLDDAVPGARNSGVYPNLNIPPQAETTQLTDEEAAARLAALQGQRASQKAQPGGQASEVERLKRLKQTHAEETLEEIEN
jgi:uncharacterized protein YceK